MPFNYATLDFIQIEKFPSGDNSKVSISIMVRGMVTILVIIGTNIEL